MHGTVTLFIVTKKPLKMSQASYTLQEAQAICEQYQYLQGKLMFPDKDWTIDCVAIAPADRLNQWLFAHFYLDFGCPVAALRFYKYDRYDIIVLSIRDRNNMEVVFKDIRSFLEDHWQQPLDPI